MWPPTLCFPSLHPFAPHNSQEFQYNCWGNFDNCVSCSTFNYSVAIRSSIFPVLLITSLWLIDSVSLSSIYSFAQFSGKEHPVKLAVQCTPPNPSWKLTSPVAPVKHSTELRQWMVWMAVQCSWVINSSLHRHCITHQAYSLTLQCQESTSGCMPSRATWRGLFSFVKT